MYKIFYFVYKITTTFYSVFNKITTENCFLSSIHWCTPNIIRSLEVATYYIYKTNREGSTRSIINASVDPRYQPECRARRAARRLISGVDASVDGRPRTTIEVGCVFIIPSSILIDLFAIITLPKSTRRAPGRHIKNK